MSRITKFNLYEWIYLSFALDSMLKVAVGGVRVHLGILLLLVVMFAELFLSGKVLRLRLFLTKNWSIIPFFCYMVVTIIMGGHYPGTAKIFVYYSLGLLIFYFFYQKVSCISSQAIVFFQWLIVLSGLLQFFLFKLFNYQLAFFIADHYTAQASFATRMRGFFLEPNWYSISITFNTLLLTMLFRKKLLKKRGLVFCTLLCFLFNGSYTSIGIITLVLLCESAISLYKLSKTKIIIAFLACLLLLAVAGARITIGESKNNINYGRVAVNYSSRLRPLLKTVNYLADYDISKKIFGFGIGSWPYVGLENNLGYIGFTKQRDIKPAARDSAEVQVFILEMGYLSLLFLFFDYAYNYIRYRRKNLIYAISCAYLAACFFLYPVFYFLIYTASFYLIRARATGGVRDNI